MPRKKVPKIQAPTVNECATAIDWPPEKWIGHCYSVAYMIRGQLDIPSRLVYGHWLGPVDPAAPMFGKRSHLPFQNHAWLELPDKSVMDFTRWVFENAAPYVYLGVNDYYDEGGDVWRQNFHDCEEVPDADADERIVPLDIADADTRWFVIKIFDTEPEKLNLAQVVYLANLSRTKLGRYIRTVYASICAAGQDALIPIDNMMSVFADKEPPKF